MMDNEYASFNLTSYCLPCPLSGLEKDAEGYLGISEKFFVFSMVWSVMAAADESGRAKLDTFLRDVEVHPLHRHPVVQGMQLPNLERLSYELLVERQVFGWIHGR